ncbi:M48 family metallopeptidase [Paroceanicella profunda]|uniref:M48 family metallopeptidase n=1 Tax=Paroceanicella profunda TaxID=2579971 RepID=A0A5B8FYS3_9RHOB|nr:SprT family zinc-dependent metalloprotease [Paroceanicella profunda]QDL91829.1 M48 family metallopeptidase [Paroceanicella profunda]
MGDTITLLDPPVDIRLKRLARARRLTLRIAATDGSVHLTLPAHVSLAEARMFVLRQEDWLRSRLSRAPQPVLVAPGMVLPVEGKMTRVLPGTGRRVLAEADTLAVPGPAETAGRRVEAWLRTLARERLVPAVDGYAARLRRAPGRVTLRDTGSRWGSCTSRGDLMFSWRLAMAPPEVLDYVAAHEAAHLVEMNHSDRFWAQVAGICPDYARHRAWLRTHGATLHRYRFR